MNDPLLESLESRVRRWLRTRPLNRPECPSCLRAAGTWSGLHGRGCYAMAVIRGEVRL